MSVGVQALTDQMSGVRAVVKCLALRAPCLQSLSVHVPTVVSKLRLTTARSPRFLKNCHRMLVNGLSVERTDLAPSPGLILHGVGDKSPALWRVYVRAPYVVQNSLPCDIVLWCAQPPMEDDDGEEGDTIGPSPAGSRGSRGRTPHGALRRRTTISHFG